MSNQREQLFDLPGLRCLDHLRTWNKNGLIRSPPVAGDPVASVRHLEITFKMGRIPHPSLGEVAQIVGILLFCKGAGRVLEPKEMPLLYKGSPI